MRQASLACPLYSHRQSSTLLCVSPTRFLLLTYSRVHLVGPLYSLRLTCLLTLGFQVSHSHLACNSSHSWLATSHSLLARLHSYSGSRLHSYLDTTHSHSWLTIPHSLLAHDFTLHSWPTTAHSLLALFSLSLRLTRCGTLTGSHSHSGTCTVLTPALSQCHTHLRHSPSVSLFAASQLILKG